MKLSEAIKNRVKSFIWRLGGVMAIAGLDWVANNLGLFNLDPMWITIIGLVVGEGTKFINSNLPKIE